jgi:hypothetical protein
MLTCICTWLKCLLLTHTPLLKTFNYVLRYVGYATRITLCIIHAYFIIFLAAAIVHAPSGLLSACALVLYSKRGGSS